MHRCLQHLCICMLTVFRVPINKKNHNDFISLQTKPFKAKAHILGNHASDDLLLKTGALDLSSWPDRKHLDKLN